VNGRVGSGTGVSIGQAVARRRRQFGSTDRRGTVIALVLGAVILVNLAVIAAVALVVRDPEPAIGPAAGPGANVGPSFAPGVPTVSSDRWLVDVNEAGFALRARAGECAAASGSVEQSTDGGVTWAPLPLQSIIVVHGVDAGGGADPAVVIGASADCLSREWTSTDAGRTWREGPEETPARWFRDPDLATVVRSPDGDVPGPCAPGIPLVDVRRGPGDSGLVLCADGFVARTFDDDGDRWQDLGRVPDGSSLSYVGDTGFVAARSDRCDGVEIVTSGTAAWSPLACVPGAAPEGAAIAIAGGRGLLVTFSGTWATTNGGQSWGPP
jgi:hypothetical protein